jgi:hypothetical protein
MKSRVEGVASLTCTTTSLFPAVGLQSRGKEAGEDEGRPESVDDGRLDIGEGGERGEAVYTGPQVEVKGLHEEEDTDVASQDTIQNPVETEWGVSSDQMTVTSKAHMESQTPSHSEAPQVSPAPALPVPAPVTFTEERTVDKKEEDSGDEDEDIVINVLYPSKGPTNSNPPSMEPSTPATDGESTDQTTAVFPHSKTHQYMVLQQQKLLHQSEEGAAINIEGDERVRTHRKVRCKQKKSKKGTHKCIE